MKKVFALLMVFVLTLGAAGVAFANTQRGSDAGIQFYRAPYNPGILPDLPGPGDCPCDCDDCTNAPGCDCCDDGPGGCDECICDQFPGPGNDAERALEAFNIHFGERAVADLAATGVSTFSTTHNVGEVALRSAIPDNRRYIQMQVRHEHDWRVQVSRSHFRQVNRNADGSIQPIATAPNVMTNSTLSLVSDVLQPITAATAPRLHTPGPVEVGAATANVIRGYRGYSRASFSATLAVPRVDIPDFTNNDEFATVFDWQLIQGGDPGGS